MTNQELKIKYEFLNFGKIKSFDEIIKKTIITTKSYVQN